MNAVPPPPTRRQTTKQLRTALQQPTGKNLANVHRVRCMQTHQKLPEKVKAEVARNTLKQGEISPRMIAVEGRRDKLFETLTRLAEHLEMGYAKASTTISGGGGGGEATSPGGTGGGPAEWRGWEVEEAEAGADDTQISSLRRSIAAQVRSRTATTRLRFPSSPPLSHAHTLPLLSLSLTLPLLSLGRSYGCRRSVCAF